MASMRITTGAVTLTYREAGMGEPVLLLHGLADHGGVWQGVIDTLSPHYRCIAPDLRGHGDSDKPDRPDAYGSLEFVADLEALATQLALTSLRVVAHSWAAKLALLWARIHPTRIQTLVLVDPFFVNKLSPLFRPTFPLLYRTLPFLKVMGPFADYDQAVALAKTLKQYSGWSPVQASVFEAAMEQKADGTWGSKFTVAARNGVFNDILQLAGLTAALPTPTHLLLPEQGLNRMAWQINPYKTYLPQLTMQTIPGNHWPHLVTPESCTPAIAQAVAVLPEMAS
jgi:pimeloyl-ACP methyl ester carboxylesterase